MSDDIRDERACIFLGNNSGAHSEGFHNIGIGDDACELTTGSHNIAIGYYSGSHEEAKNTIAVGSCAVVQGSHSVAIGSYSHAYNGGIAIGQDSYSYNSREVSFGSGGLKRRITNIDCGINPTDAVTVQQLQEEIQKLREWVDNNFAHIVKDQLTAEGKQEGKNYIDNPSFVTWERDHTKADNQLQFPETETPMPTATEMQKFTDDFNAAWNNTMNEAREYIIENVQKLVDDITCKRQKPSEYFAQGQAVELTVPPEDNTVLFNSIKNEPVLCDTCEFRENKSNCGELKDCERYFKDRNGCHVFASMTTYNDGITRIIVPMPLERIGKRHEVMFYLKTGCSEFCTTVDASDKNIPYSLSWFDKCSRCVHSDNGQVDCKIGGPNLDYLKKEGE